VLILKLYAMKKTIGIIVSLLCLTSCGSLLPNTYYLTSLVSVESPVNTSTQYGETKIVGIQDEDSVSKYCYEDDYIKIIWFIGDSQLNFFLTNKSDFSIKLPWDDMVYVDENGKSKRVIHNGIRYIDKGSTQVASVVPKDATIEDLLIPSDNIYFSDDNKWIEKPLFPYYYSQETANENFIAGKTIKIIFPVIIQDIPNEYVFKFSINGVLVK